jgi:hypothetical protein
MGSQFEHIPWKTRVAGLKMTRLKGGPYAS